MMRLGVRREVYEVAPLLRGALVRIRNAHLTDRQMAVGEIKINPP